jgi:hypothetical protein
MSITPAQRALAEQRQWLAAQDNAAQIRLVAGPGTGRSKTIEKRVAHVLNTGAMPQRVYVISFTLASSKVWSTAYEQADACHDWSVAGKAPWPNQPRKFLLNSLIFHSTNEGPDRCDFRRHDRRAMVRIRQSTRPHSGDFATRWAGAGLRVP